MIFVTVGTHEQQFTRLIKKIDELVESGVISEQVFIQKGYTKYNPINCEYKDMITSEEMINYTKKARIIITHGGPGSIMLPFQLNKIPIVVPRQKEFNEHVDNHQVKFTKKLEANKKILAVYDIDLLEETIVGFDILIEKYNSNYENTTDMFVENFEKICMELLK